MSSSVDRELVMRLLRDESLSFREIARRANCSDWSVRSIVREIDGDDSFLETDPPALAQWVIGAVIFVVLMGAVCYALWRIPPSDCGAM
jgi:hypothetical protein